MDILTAVQNRAKELQPLYDRRLYDIETLYNLKAYKYERTDGKTQGFESMTLNAPRVYADKVIQLLNTAALRYNIQPLDPKKTTREVCSTAEDFLRFCRQRADEYNLEMGYFPIAEADSFYACLEGAIARIVLTQKSGKMYQHTIIPVDPYNVVYQFGKDGYRGIYGKMSREQIFTQYNFEISAKEATVMDIWTDIERIVKVGDKDVPGFNYKHRQRKNPFLYVGVPTTPAMAAMGNAVAYQNESIFSGVRSSDRSVDLFKELNRAYSEWKTQNTMTIRPPLQFVHPDDERPEIEKPASGADNTVATGKGEFKAIPMPTFPNTYMASISQIQQWIQRGTMANIEYGELKLHGLSALALKDLKSSKDQTFIPRLSAMNHMDRLTAYRLIEQMIDGGYPTDFDGGYELPFDIKDLKHEFIIKAEHLAESPEENIAQLQMAASARAEGLPDEHIYAVQLQIEDVDKLMRQKAMQEARTENIIIRRLWEAKQLTEEYERTGDEFLMLAAKIAAAEVGYDFQNGQFNERATQLPSQPSPSNMLQTPSLGAPRNDAQLMQRNENKQDNIKESQQSVRRING